MIPYYYNDGGRTAAGYVGEASDCVVRAIAIATGIPYKTVYHDLYAAQIAFGTGHSREAKAAAKNPSPRNGVWRKVYEPYLLSKGFKWMPTMLVGAGCKVHLKPEELPLGTIIVRLSKHIACVKDRVLYDTNDCSRVGTRCVYGYFYKPVPMRRTKFSDKNIKD